MAHTICIFFSNLYAENIYGILFFCIKQDIIICRKELDKRFAVVQGKKITKKARIEATILNSLTPLSIKQRKDKK